MKSIYKSKIIIFILLTIVACSSKKIELIRDIKENNANEIVAALLSEGIEAEKKQNKKSLSVIIGKNDMARAVEILKSRGLPNKNHSNLGEVFKREGMISTPLEERARYIYALSQELESTLSEIDGILVARVHVVLPERIAPGQPIQPPSAAIFVKHLKSLDPDAVEHKIRRLVTSSIPGLSGENSKEISISFVASDHKKTEINLVKTWGLTLTKDSSEELKDIVYRFMIIFIISVILIVFLIIKMKRRRNNSKKSVKEKGKPDSDSDIFVGEPTNF